MPKGKPDSLEDTLAGIGGDSAPTIKIVSNSNNADDIDNKKQSEKSASVAKKENTLKKGSRTAKSVPVTTFVSNEERLHIKMAALKNGFTLQNFVLVGINKMLVEYGEKPIDTEE